jgi:hypothetical protein
MKTQNNSLTASEMKLKINAKKLKDAVWVCYSCGTKYGRWYQGDSYSGPAAHCSTNHIGTCDVCGTVDVSVTEPRDYGHLVLVDNVQIE